MPYIGNFNNEPRQVQSGNMIWLDYLIASNPQGIMRVLANYGYTGYLAPMNEQELYEATHEFIERQGDKAVIELLKTHPLYETIAELSREELKVSVPFKNASGDGTIFTTLQTVNIKRLIEVTLVLIGAFYVAEWIWRKVKD